MDTVYYAKFEVLKTVLLKLACLSNWVFSTSDFRKLKLFPSSDKEPCFVGPPTEGAVIKH